MQDNGWTVAGSEMERRKEGVVGTDAMDRHGLVKTEVHGIIGMHCGGVVQEEGQWAGDHVLGARAMAGWCRTLPSHQERRHDDGEESGAVVHAKQSTVAMMQVALAAWSRAKVGWIDEKRREER